MIRNIRNDYYYKYIANITYKQFSKWSFRLWFYNFIKNTGKRKKRWYLSEEKSRRTTKYCYYNDIYQWKRDIFSSEVEITRGIVWINIKTRAFLKKDLMNLIETDHQININFYHSVSSNNSFKSHLNAKNFNMFLTL